MFGGLYCPSLCGWHYRYLWAQQRAALLCRRDRSFSVRSVGKLLRGSVVVTLSADWHMYNPLLCYLPLNYCWPALSLFGWLRDPLLCYPHLHYCWGRCCPFSIRLAALSSTVIHPPTLMLWQVLPVFLYGWLRDHLLCYLPLQYCWGRYAARVFIRLAARPSTWLPSYTIPRLNAACFGAMSGGVLGEPLSCYTLYCT